MNRRIFTPRVYPFSAPPKSPSSIGSRRHRRTKKQSTKKIVLHPDQYRLNYFTKICPNADNCLMVGVGWDYMRKLFENYNLNYLKGYSVLSEGNNGVTIKLMFEKNTINLTTQPKVSAVLKFPLGTEEDEFSADNLFYEYMSGLYINEFCNPYFPCFIETLNLYQFNEIEIENENKKNGNRNGIFGLLKNSNFKNNLSIKNILNIYDNYKYDEICEKTDNFVLATQYINGMSLDRLFNNYIEKKYGYHNVDKRNFFLGNEMVYILFQVYSALAHLDGEFSHNDLHSKNILLNQLPDDKYINMVYCDEHGDVIVSFYTQYIVKIIDYGRAFFKSNKSINKAICDEIKCTHPKPIDEQKHKDDKHECGYFYGFYFDKPNEPYNVETSQSRYFIDVTHYNSRRDLNLINSLLNVMNANDNYECDIALSMYINMVKFDGTEMVFDNRDPSKETITEDYNLFLPPPVAGYTTTKSKTQPLINTVKDAYKFLLKCLNKKSSGKKKDIYGTLKIFLTEPGTEKIPMEFISNTDPNINYAKMHHKKTRKTRIYDPSGLWHTPKSSHSSK